MSTINRKLVTIRTIDSIQPIAGADAIECAVIGGWTVVVKRGEFVPGDEVFYFEIDSFLPEGVPAWQFLVDKQGREFNGVRGHRLRTVRLRGQISQGFVLPLDAFPVVRDGAKADPEYDIAAALDIVKWEQPLPAELAGQAEGLFPSFIRRTDQERCQNLVQEIFSYDEMLVEFDVTGMQQSVIDQLERNGVIKFVPTSGWVKVQRAKADRNARYEVTLKMDGSSCTVFARAGINEVETGVCSRNLQLKVNGANADNTFVKVALQSGLLGALEQIARNSEGNFAVQGELMGPGIQGNRENLKVHQLFIFDVQNIDKQTYMTPAQRAEFMFFLYSNGVNPYLVKHVPVLHDNVTLDELGITNAKELLAFAEGPSLAHQVREGLVFKRVDGQFSFKAISQKYLMAERD